MPLEIKKVETGRDLKTFIRFPKKMYADNECYVPALEFDELNTLSPKTNPAAGFCDSALYLALRDGKVVGRVAAIVNRKANEQWNHQEVRFGWYDFVDDKEVSEALMDKVVEFGRERGMDKVVGPLGFTDFDPEGMLVEGFDRMSTMPMIYNAPYYQDHMTAMGFGKDADWLEYKITIPEKLPERYTRLSRIIAERNGVHIRQLTRKILRKEDYGRKVFKLINDTYKDLYNYTVMPSDLADKYIGFYLSILDLKYLSMIENDKGELVAFGITMPSLTRALRKSGGRLFPFGWWPILKSMFIKHEEGVELLLIGVKQDYRKSGITSLLFMDLFEKFSAMGLKWAETNAELETNNDIRNQWEGFEYEQKKRRRSYIKDI